MKVYTRLFAAGVLAGAVAAMATAALAEPTDRGITVALAVELDSLDACDTQPAQNANIGRGNIYESLTHVSPIDGKVEPLLALSWEQIDDLTWEFKLRPDVKFHDGSPFTAEVAAANINRSQPGAKINGQEIACLNLTQFPEAVNAEAVDELTLRVTTPKSTPSCRCGSLSPTSAILPRSRPPRRPPTRSAPAPTSSSSVFMAKPSN